MTTLAISQDDLLSFHATHFSSVATNHFSEHFLVPVEETEHVEEADDEGLGYYEDGTIRTLTDEQIAMFRHSEIQTLLRERRHAREARECDGEKQEATTPVDEGDLEDGELGEEGDDVVAAAHIPPPPTKNKRLTKKEKKIQYAKEKGFFKQKIKPDLRKRTWDKVDTGLDGLDYDESNNGSARTPPMATQRRKISYDDD